MDDHLPFDYEKYLKTPDDFIDLGEFQNLTMDWSRFCFPHEVIFSMRERNQRFLEEALELVQSLGCSASEAHQLVDYVYSRPIGNSMQEVGGVANTLVVLAHVNGINFEDAALKELDRVWKKAHEIRMKQKSKPIIRPEEERNGHS